MKEKDKKVIKRYEILWHIGMILFTIFIIFLMFLPKQELKADENVPLLDTNIDIPTLEIINDVWLDGEQVSDKYYRVDIIYDGIVYFSLEDIKLAYENNIIPSNTLLYIDLDPMYNFIFAVRKDQGNGLYYWNESGPIDPESFSEIKTIIIDKDGLNYKAETFNSSWYRKPWDDFDMGPTAEHNAIIGYENQRSIDYYDYNQGYYDGYWDGRSYGYERGMEYGIEKGKISGYENGYDEAKNEFGYNYNGIIIPGQNAYDYGYAKGTQESGELKANIIDFVPGVLGSIFMFFFQLGQIGILGITILDILGILVLISGLIFLIKFFF